MVAAIVGLCAVLAAAALLLKEIADAIEASGDTSLAEAVDNTVRTVLGSPLPREIAIMLIRAIFNLLFRSQQSNRDYVAISYAVMDGHDYLDRLLLQQRRVDRGLLRRCPPGPLLCLCRCDPELRGLPAGAAESSSASAICSLRYVLGSDALIAPSRFPETIVIEVAALRDAAGSVDFVMNAARVARNPIFGASFHWGQFNPLERPEIDLRRRQSAGRLRLQRPRAALPGRRRRTGLAECRHSPARPHHSGEPGRLRTVVCGRARVMLVPASCMQIVTRARSSPS